VGWDNRADRRPLLLPAFARNERSEAGFEGFSGPPFGVETLALRDLPHRYRIAQDIQRLFQAFVLVVIHQHGRLPAAVVNAR